MPSCIFLTWLPFSDNLVLEPQITYDKEKFLNMTNKVFWDHSPECLYHHLWSFWHFLCFSHPDFQPVLHTSVISPATGPWYATTLSKALFLLQVTKQTFTYSLYFKIICTFSERSSSSSFIIKEIILVMTLKNYQFCTYHKL